MSRRVVDERGRPIVLSSFQKNEIYNKAKQMRREIEDSLLKKDEMWVPNQQNIEKFRQREGHPDMTKKIELYRKHMEAIGADPKDIGIRSRRKAR